MITAFDKVAKTYWQQYLAGSPIGGGMAYAEFVQKCTLDDSMDSLKQLDKLLIAVKKDLDNNQQKNSAELLRQAPFRNFLLFLGFYAGRVVAQQLNTQMSWLDFEALSARHTMTADKTFFVAVAGVPTNKPEASPFFVLNVLGAKLFGSFNQKFTNPITGQLMSESLYWGVLGYLDDLKQNSELINSIHHQKTTLQTTAIRSDEPKGVATPINQEIQKTAEQIPAPAPELIADNRADLVALPATKVSPSVTQEPIQPPQIATTPKAQPSQLQSKSAPLVSNESKFDNSNQSKLGQPKSDHSALPPQGLSRRAKEKLERQKNAYKAHFKEVKEDIVTLVAVNNTHDDQFAKAKAVIDKVYELTEGDEDKLAQLNDKQQATLTQVIELLKKLANAGNTNALLTLAVCYFEGIGVAKDEKTATPLVQRAAEAGDVRAAKFLSRIYYHGLGVNPSTELGELWLNKAADGGHEEAKKIKQQFNQIRAMQDDQRVEAYKDRQFMMILVAVAVIFVIVIALSAKYL